MSSEIKVPTLPESIADALIVTWHKKPGDPVKRDEVLVDVETDKVVLEVPAAEDGVLGEIIEDEGATVEAHQVIGTIEAAGAGAGDDAADGSSGEAGEDGDADDDEADDEAGDGAGSKDGAKAKKGEKGDADAGDAPDGGGKGGGQTSPSVRKLLAEHGLSADEVSGTGKNGRISKEDVERHVADGGESGYGGTQSRPAAPKEDGGKRGGKQAGGAAKSGSAKSDASGGALDIGGGQVGERAERRVPMTRLRARIAERLLQASQTTAMLTTFNEVDMSGFIALRGQYKETFEKSHGIKLGFMSIFLKAATEALKRYPDINASIDGDEIVYHGYCDIGVAVSSDRGLVVPVLRNTEHMSLADMEKAIGDYAEKARAGKLGVDDMTGGTFTVSNGGVFGSMMSTPILNPPQSAILGMHATQERAVVVDGEIVVRPMMYVALSYDHRIVDGKGAVGFLKTIKEIVEQPARVIFDV